MRITLASRAALIASATTLALGTVAACGPDSGADSAGGRGKLPVVAAFYPLQYVTEQVGGAAVKVTNLVKPGAEPHDLELDPRQMAQVGRRPAGGLPEGFQPALDDAVEQEAADRAFDVATVSPLADSGANHRQPRG